MQRKVPLPGRIFARCILQRRFAGHFGCMARTSCQSQPVFGCMERKTCHEAPLFSSEAPFGIHGVKKLPRIAARERIRAQSCHRQAPATPQRHVPQRLASQPHRCSRRTPRPCPTCPSLMPPRRPPQRRDAMRRMRRFCRCWKSKLRVTGVNEVKRTTCFGLSAIVPLTY